jgi:hypothetical protein
MCNFGGSSTNTNQIIRGPRDPNRTKLKKPMDTVADFGNTTLSGMGQSVSKSKSTSGMTASDNYKG